MSKIQWTDETWNPTTTLHPDRLEQPLHWRKPRRIFVDSMSDLFHEDVPFAYIDQVFGTMIKAHWHVFMILTKRPERALRCMEFFGPRMDGGPVPVPNVWLGVSVEDQATADERIPWLLKTTATGRWVSYEPALGPIDFRVVPIPVHGPRELAIRRLDWLLIGGEHGPRARPCDVRWIRSVVDQCRQAEVPCFVKQLGSRPVEYDGSLGTISKYNPPDSMVMALHDPNGGDPSEWPEDLRVRQYPEVEGTE